MSCWMASLAFGKLVADEGANNREVREIDLRVSVTYMRPEERVLELLLLDLLLFGVFEDFLLTVVAMDHEKQVDNKLLHEIDEAELENVPA